jgi:putative ABC transport system permease protein
MLLNYFKTAWRVMIREKYFTLINLVGLASALTTVLFIAVYVHHELSYDQLHPDVERIYRVNQTNIWTEESSFMSSTVLPLANALQTEYPEIASTLRINTVNLSEIRYQDDADEEQLIISNQILAADSTFFDFFAFDLQARDKSTALSSDTLSVLSHEAAMHMF